jgi:hypothetical protein
MYCSPEKYLYTDRKQKTGRIITIPLVGCAACMFGIAFWQIRERGGMGWLFGRRSKVAAAYETKGEYIDMQA